MNWNSSQVIQSRSAINYSYATIQITQSRVDKGLIAIPMSLAEWFPDYNTTIQVYLDDSLCANCHRQFEYADVQHEFNNDGWLTKVSFNRKIYSINQILLRTRLDDYVKKLFI